MLVAAPVPAVTVLLVCSPDDADAGDDAGDIDEVGVGDDVAFVVASARIRLIGSSTTTHMHTAAPKLMAARPKYEMKKLDSDQWKGLEKNPNRADA